MQYLNPKKIRITIQKRSLQVRFLFISFVRVQIWHSVRKANISNKHFKKHLNCTSYTKPNFDTERKYRRQKNGPKTKIVTKVTDKILIQTAFKLRPDRLSRARFVPARHYYISTKDFWLPSNGYLLQIIPIQRISFNIFKDILFYPWPGMRPIESRILVRLKLIKFFNLQNGYL